MKVVTPWVFCALALASWPSKAQVAAENSEKAAKAVAEAFSGIDSFAIPDSPAAALLGDAEIAISRPQSVQAVAAEIARYREKGKETPGISLVLAPGLLVAGKGITYRRYHDDIWVRQLTRMELSAGLTESPADGSTPRRAAVGLAFTPYDAGDPRLDPGLKSCMDKAYSALNNSPEPTSPGVNPAGADAITAALKEVPSCIKAFAKSLPAKQRSSDSLKLGFGKGWASAGPDSRWRDGGWGVWIAGQYSLTNARDNGPGARLLARLKRTSLSAWDATTLKWAKAREDDLALQLRVGMGGGTTDVMAELGYARRPGGTGSERRWSVGLEKLILPDTWLVLTASAKNGGDPGEPRSSILGRIKYNFSSAPVLGL